MDNQLNNPIGDLLSSLSGAMGADFDFDAEGADLEDNEKSTRQNEGKIRENKQDIRKLQQEIGKFKQDLRAVLQKVSGTDQKIDRLVQAIRQARKNGKQDLTALLDTLGNILDDLVSDDDKDEEAGLGVQPSVNVASGTGCGCGKYSSEDCQSGVGGCKKGFEEPLHDYESSKSEGYRSQPGTKMMKN